MENLDLANQIAKTLTDKALPFYSNIFSVLRESNNMFSAVSSCGYLREIVLYYINSTDYYISSDKYNALFKSLEDDNPSYKKKNAFTFTSCTTLYDIYMCDQ